MILRGFRFAGVTGLAWLMVVACSTGPGASVARVESALDGPDGGATPDAASDSMPGVDAALPDAGPAPDAGGAAGACTYTRFDILDFTKYFRLEAVTCAPGKTCPHASAVPATFAAGQSSTTLACVDYDPACDLAPLLENLAHADFPVREAASAKLGLCCTTYGRRAEMSAALPSLTSPEAVARLDLEIGRCAYKLDACGMSPGYPFLGRSNYSCFYNVAAFVPQAAGECECRANEAGQPLRWHADFTWGCQVGPNAIPFYGSRDTLHANDVFLELADTCPGTIPLGTNVGRFAANAGDWVDVDLGPCGNGENLPTECLPQNVQQEADARVPANACVGKFVTAAGPTKEDRPACFGPDN